MDQVVLFHPLGVEAGYLAKRVSFLRRTFSCRLVSARRRASGCQPLRWAYSASENNSRARVALVYRCLAGLANGLSASLFLRAFLTSFSARCSEGRWLCGYMGQC